MRRTSPRRRPRPEQRPHPAATILASPGELHVPEPPGTHHQIGPTPSPGRADQNQPPSSRPHHPDPRAPPMPSGRADPCRPRLHLDERSPTDLAEAQLPPLPPPRAPPATAPPDSQLRLPRSIASPVASAVSQLEGAAPCRSPPARNQKCPAVTAAGRALPGRALWRRRGRGEKSWGTLVAAGFPPGCRTGATREGGEGDTCLSGFFS